VKALRDLGLLDFDEPFARLFTQGMITRDGAKMSKSKGNMISPQTYVDRYGVDTARCYVMFIGPPDQDIDWRDDDIEGVHRFLTRLWRLCAEIGGPREPGVPGELAGDDLELVRKAHWAIDKVTHDMSGRFAFNTAIAAVMELVNECYRRRETAAEDALHFAAATAASLIFPFAPHTGADAYDALTGGRVWEQPWPAADTRYLERDLVTIVVQVNGKVRDRFEVAPGTASEELETRARELPNAAQHIDGREVVKVVVVPDKLVNVVVR
jgi:leucyl-tRNA synthetase